MLRDCGLLLLFFSLAYALPYERATVGGTGQTPPFLFMNAAVGAAAAPTPIEAWMRAAFPPRIWNEPWELRGALDVLWEFFSQIIPKLKVEDDSFRVGIQRLNRIMPAVGDDYVDPTKLEG